MLLFFPGCAADDRRKTDSDSVASKARQVLTWSSEGARARVEQLVLIAPPESEAELRQLAPQVAAAWPELVRSLGAEPSADFELYLIPPDLRGRDDLRRLDAAAPEWAAGFLIGERRIGGLRLDRVDRYPYKDALAVTLHEATHQILQDAVGHERLPLWFEEGVATLIGQRWGAKEWAMARGAVFLGGVPTLDEIDQGFRASAGAARLSYAASHSFVAWSERKYGRDLVPRIVGELRESDNFRAAWLAVTGEVLSGSERRWRRGGLFVYRILPLVGSSGSLWILMSLLAVAGGGKRRREFRQRMERWQAEEDARDLRDAVVAEPVPLRPEEPPDGLSARERARQRWGLPSAQSTETEGRSEGEAERPRRDDDGEWIN